MEYCHDICLELILYKCAISVIKNGKMYRVPKINRTIETLILQTVSKCHNYKDSFTTVQIKDVFTFCTQFIKLYSIARNFQI